MLSCVLLFVSVTLHEQYRSYVIATELNDMHQCGTASSIIFLRGQDPDVQYLLPYCAIAADHGGGAHTGDHCKDSKSEVNVSLGLRS